MYDHNQLDDFVAEYDATHDVLYIRLRSGNPNSYSVGNPAGIEGVEWLVAASDPTHITGAIVQDWHHFWLNHHRMPPLPVAMTWDGMLVTSQTLTTRQ